MWARLKGQACNHYDTSGGKLLLNGQRHGLQGRQGPGVQHGGRCCMGSACVHACVCAPLAVARLARARVRACTRTQVERSRQAEVRLKQEQAEALKRKQEEEARKREREQVCVCVGGGSSVGGALQASARIAVQRWVQRRCQKGATARTLAALHVACTQVGVV